MNERIKELRKALDLTQQQFADRIKVKRNTVATYEMGRSVPSDSAISLICREFHVNEDWLRTGAGEMFVQRNENELLDSLAESHHLTELERTAITAYITLGEADRAAIMRYVKKLVEECAAAPPDEASPGLEDRLAELERQNAEMAAEIAAMKEEDARNGLVG